MVVLDRSVLWVSDCIGKKPGEPVRASETCCVHAGTLAQRGVVGWVYPGNGVWHGGADPSGCPWYGSGSWSHPCFTVFFAVFRDFD